VADILDVAWAAGFIEGEGTIGIYKRWGSSKEGPTLRPLIRTTNCDRKTLEVLKRLFGGCIGIANRVEIDKWGAAHRKVRYYHYIDYRNALWAALALQPFLQGEKRKKAEEVICFYRDRRYVYAYDPVKRCPKLTEVLKYGQAS